ncbi:MAG: hypothetical protein KIT72_13955 [Polyangiaceae bacterium]|nr:hypothetical protein [Polyangiaceae bacterium]MCW5791516.1 hypothetical protein [Polyangiaceae bacterium]
MRYRPTPPHAVHAFKALRGWGGVALLGAWLVGCASAPPPSSARQAPRAELADGEAESPAAAGYPDDMSRRQAAPGYPEKGGAHDALDGPRYSSPPPRRQVDPVTLLEWEEWLDDELTALSESESRQGPLDCTNACRALEGLTRAKQRICELSGERDLEGRCARATLRVKRAEERVRAACQCSKP